MGADEGSLNQCDAAAMAMATNVEHVTGYAGGRRCKIRSYLQKAFISHDIRPRPSVDVHVRLFFTDVKHVYESSHP